MSKEQEFNRRFASLRSEFVADIRGNVARIQALLDGAADANSWRQVEFIAHQYSGNGLTFGFPAISEEGRRLELIIDREKSRHGDETSFPLLAKACAPFLELLNDVARLGVQIPALAANGKGETAGSGTVLLVDDDKQMVQLLARTLEKTGYATLIAENGQKALELARKHLPDLILLDGMLPDMDGFSVLQALKNTAATRGVPVVMLSARRQEKSMKAALAMGAAEYLVKPFKPDELAAHVSRLTSKIMSGKEEKTSATEVPQAESVQKTVCLLAREAGQGEDIAAQLRHFGYEAMITPSIAEFKDAIAHRPYARIAYSDLSEPDCALLASAGYKKEPDAAAAHLVIAARDDFNSRLRAARLGVGGYFTEPVDVLKIIDKIEQLGARYKSMPPYHVLIVDDDAMLTGFYTQALRQAGMNVTSVSAPEAALSILAEQTVDLVLIDYTMPHCNGDELIAIIRQHDSYVSLPIVVMSANDMIENLLINTGLGIDDFLVKPITPSQLVAIVQSRAQRAAELQGLMARDSFTGLFNHAHFTDMLGMELSQARRHKLPGCYAIIDIDHFKSVNDTHGHAAGDRVIKSLARMLQQRLRRTDIVGRCGGEEFGIIMPGCDLENAMQIIENLRERFARSTYRVEKTEIGVTFSGGLASLTEYENADALIGAADKALYEAKAQGRNRVVLAGKAP